MLEKREPEIISHVPGLDYNPGVQAQAESPQVINCVPESQPPKRILGVVAEDGRVIPIKKEEAAAPEIITNAPKNHPKPDLRLAREIITQVPGFKNLPPSN